MNPRFICAILWFALEVEEQHLTKGVYVTL